MGNEFWILLIGAVAAIAAWSAVLQNAKNIQAQIFLQINTEYASPEMHTCLKKVREYKRDLGIIFPSYFKEGKGCDTYVYDEVNDSRRIISHFYYKIAMLRIDNIISVSFFKLLVPDEQVGLLLEIIEPLDEAINPDYGKTPYDLYRKHHPKMRDRWPRNYILIEAAKKGQRELNNRQ